MFPRALRGPLTFGPFVRATLWAGDCFSTTTLANLSVSVCSAVAGVIYVPLARSGQVGRRVLLICRMLPVSHVGVCAKGQGIGYYRPHPKA